jgi:hypothetical protein
MLAEDDISENARLTTCGRPWPPKAGSEPSAGQPPSTSFA